MSKDVKGSIGQKSEEVVQKELIQEEVVEQEESKKADAEQEQKGKGNQDGKGKEKEVVQQKMGLERFLQLEPQKSGISAILRRRFALDVKTIGDWRTTVDEVLNRKVK